MDIYKFETHSINDDLHSLGRKLQSQELTGIILEEFILPAEAAALRKGFYNLKPSEVTVVDDGFTSYPASFAQYTQGITSGTLAKSDFHKSAQDYRTDFEKQFAVDVEGRLKAVIARMFAGKDVLVPWDKEQQGSFVPFTFRELKPGKGELKVHCENLFFNEFPHFFSQMEHIVLRNNEFSFFIVVSAPEEGGELTLYDLNWNKVKVRKTFTNLVDENSNDIDIEQEAVPKQKLSPKEGSLLIFSGGDVWHRVEIVRGNKSRITIGGFISTGVESDKLYIWS